MVILYKTRHAYGRTFRDIIDPVVEQAYRSLTGQVTLTDSALVALERLGITVEESN